MPAITPFQRELEELEKANADIAEVRRRIDNQLDLIEWLEDKGQDTIQAEALLLVLEQTVVGRQRHRQLILDDIARDEGAAPDPAKRTTMRPKWP